MDGLPSPRGSCGLRNEEGSNLQSVTRALRSLEVIADAGELGVTELAKRLGVHKATASRLAATLADHGLVERDPVTDKYRLGFGLVHLAGAAMAGLDLVSTSRPILEDLAEKTRETVNLGVLSGDGLVCIDQVAGARSIVSVSWVGRRTPLHCTSNGKVLLAYLPTRSANGSSPNRSSAGRRDGHRSAKLMPSSARSARAGTDRRAKSSRKG